MASPPVAIVRASPQVKIVAAAAPEVAVVLQRGKQGAPGEDGVAVRFEHVQSTPAAEWTVNHNLGAPPMVTLLSVGGVEMEALVTHVNNGQVRVNFSSAVAGRALCL